MITQYGMSEKFGLMGLATQENQYLSGRAVLNCGDDTATEIDHEVMKLLHHSYEEAKRILGSHRTEMDKIAEYLIRKETITAEASTVEGILRSYVNDYCQDMMEQRIREGVDPKIDFAADIIMNSDLSDLRYLYKYGEYVSENEIGVAEFLNSLSQDEIDKMASTYTEGYRIGFITGRKDITKKKTVNIRYSLGFERMVKAAIIQFRKIGLDPDSEH